MPVPENKLPFFDKRRKVWKVPLTKGYHAIISAQDVKRVSKFSWYAQERPDDGGAYAASTTKIDAEGHRDRIYMHRYILRVRSTKTYVDHKDHDTLNCRRGNLRKASNTSNQANQRVAKNNTTGFKGVSILTADNVYVAHFRKHLGRFPTPEAAARCYDKALLKAGGKFALTNKAMGLYV